MGPRDLPIAPKRDGYNVHVIDHLDRARLVEKYTGHPVDLDRIEEVDFIWNGQSYAQLVGGEKCYDWVIASHVIEHTPNLIGFLLDCESILKDDGVLFLVVPDKRYCYDYCRPLTGISKVIDAFLRKDTIHTPGTLLEDRLNMVSKGGVISWDKNATGQLSLNFSMEDAKRSLEAGIQGGEYIDSHAWCFVPHSFRLMIEDLFNLGFISFREVEFFGGHGCQFYITLGRKGKGVGLTRLELLRRIESEVVSTYPSFNKVWGTRMLNQFRKLG
ncbi:MAG: class I SAM-dependent methyltransferase [Limisphaerales bacterium]